MRTYNRFYIVRLEGFMYDDLGHYKPFTNEVVCYTPYGSSNALALAINYDESFFYHLGTTVFWYKHVSCKRVSRLLSSKIFLKKGFVLVPSRHGFDKKYL